MAYVDRVISNLRQRFSNNRSLMASFRNFDADHSGDVSFDEFKGFLQHLGYNLSDKQVAMIVNRTDVDGNSTVEFEEFCQQFHEHNIPAAIDGKGNVTAAIGEVAHLATNADGAATDGADGTQPPEESTSGASSPRNDELMSLDEAAKAEHQDVTARVDTIIAQLKRKVAQKGSMRTVFREYDANHDGCISRDEFQAALLNLNLIVTENELDALLTLVDSHHKDEIMYDDFCAKFADDPTINTELEVLHALPDFSDAKHKAACLTPKLSELATRLQSGSGMICYFKMIKAFRDFDSDKEGYIARDDFRLAIDRISRLGATTGISSSVSWEDEVDANGGLVDYVAFVERMRQEGVSKPADFIVPPTLRDRHPGRAPRGSFGYGGNGSDSSNGAGYASSMWSAEPTPAPTRFQASLPHQYKNTSYITVPAEDTPSFVGNAERFQTYRQGGAIDTGVRNYGRAVPSAKAERIRKNQARIQASLQEEATKKIQQEAARIESLSIQRQRYLDTLQQATKGKGLRQAHTQAQSFSLG